MNTYNPGQNIWELYNILAPVGFATSKTNLISSMVNYVYELPHESPNDLRIRILVNCEILEKSQIWVDT